MKNPIFLFLLSQSLHAQDIPALIRRKSDSIAYFQSKIKVLQIGLEDLKLQKLRKDLKTNGLPKLGEVLSPISSVRRLWRPRMKMLLKSLKMIKFPALPIKS
jgi:hypothetical protein